MSRPILVSLCVVLAILAVLVSVGEAAPRQKRQYYGNQYGYGSYGGYDNYGGYENYGGYSNYGGYNQGYGNYGRDSGEFY